MENSGTGKTVLYMFKETLASQNRNTHSECGLCVRSFTVGKCFLLCFQIYEQVGLRRMAQG